MAKIGAPSSLFGHCLQSLHVNGGRPRERPARPVAEASECHSEFASVGERQMHQRESVEGRLRGWRLWLTRLGVAFTTAVLTLTALELLTWAIWGRFKYPLPDVQEAARYLYFSVPMRIFPLFVLEEVDGTPVFRSAPATRDRNWFVLRDQCFPARRSQNAVRVAFLGASSVQGWPYREEGVAFPELVGRYLEEQYPNIRVDVINAGVGTYNSFQLLDVANQLDVFNPDVVVIYAGHNDQGYYLFYRAFLDGLTPQWTLGRLANQLNCYRGARLLRDHLWYGEERWRLNANGDQRVFFASNRSIRQMGADRYASFMRLHVRYVAELFAANLEEVVQTLNDEDTSLMLVKPACNLRDFPPAFSMHSTELDIPKKRQFNQLIDKAMETMKEGGIDFAPPSRTPAEPVAASGPDVVERDSARAIATARQALSLLDRALKISDSHAMAWYLRGRCLLHVCPRQALDAFKRARDFSPALPPHQRASQSLIDVVAKIGRTHAVPVVDLPNHFAALAKSGVPGNDLFHDNLHFNRAGHRAVAKRIAEELGKLDLFSQGPPFHRVVDLKPHETQQRLLRARDQFAWGSKLHIIPDAVAMP